MIRRSIGIALSALGLLSAAALLAAYWRAALEALTGRVLARTPPPGISPIEAGTFQVAILLAILASLILAAVGLAISGAARAPQPRDR